MRLIIDIPKEFEKDFEKDCFEDALQRLSADAHCLAGLYEKETAMMFVKAFKEAEVVDKQGVRKSNK